VPKKFGSESKRREVGDRFFAQNSLKVLQKFFEESLEKVLTKLLKKNLLILFPQRGSSLKFTLCD